MLGKTSIAAIRSLLFLAGQDSSLCWSPRRLAEILDESPTYLAKVARHLVKHRILEAEKGAKGGVRLGRRPEEITLLAVVEACHGPIVGDYCRSARPSNTHCNFHRAAMELHEAITGVLGRWTVADLLERPAALHEAVGGVTCLMAGSTGVLARMEARG
jgi:Rrf2 family protein